MDLERLRQALREQVSQTAKRLRQLASGQLAEPVIQLGKNALTGQQLRIPLAKLQQAHTHIMGQTGSGKTKAVQLIVQQIIAAGFGVIVLDAKEDLYSSLLKYCIACGHDDRLILIDPDDVDPRREDSFAVGINYLELFGQVSPTAQAAMVLAGFKKMWGESKEHQVWLEEWAPTVFEALLRQGQTLMEVFDFISLRDSTFRKLLLKSLGEDCRRIDEQWQELEQSFPKFQQALMLQSLRSRVTTLGHSEQLRYMLGQTKTTVNWRKVMDQDGIVLVKAGETAKLPLHVCKIIGIALLHQILTCARQRPEGERRPCWLVVDEFQTFACPDFVEALTKLRSFGVNLILSNQMLSQLEEVPSLKEAVISQCKNKLYFAMSRLDAEELVGELFAQDLRGDTIKHRIWQTKFRPHETTRVIETQSHADSCQESRSTSQQSSDASGQSESFGPPGLIAEGQPLGSGSSRQTGSSSGSSESSGTGSTDGWSRSEVPWYEYEPFQEESSRQYWGIEEIAAKCMTWLQCQTQREAQLKLGTQPPLPVYVGEVTDHLVLAEEIRRVKKKIYPGFSRPVQAVKKEIEGRVAGFIEAHAPKEESAGLGRPPTDFRQPELIIPTYDATEEQLKRRRGPKAKVLPRQPKPNAED